MSPIPLHDISSYDAVELMRRAAARPSLWQRVMKWLAEVIGL